MRRSLLIGRAVSYFLFLVFAVSAAHAEERIDSFYSEITVNADATIEITETLTVTVEGNKIKRGIYRDFPTRYKDRSGNNYTVDFQVRRVLRDGSDEPYRIEPLANGSRVYFGSKDIFLAPGQYIYEFSYRTNRQIGFFQDHDELYWNVTGNGWDFPIGKARATVWLPQDALERVISYEGYTGLFGAKGGDYVSRIDNQGSDPRFSLAFYTTRSLAPAEGLTISVSWPKGYVAEPDIKEKINYFLRDNRVIAFGLLGLAVVLGYYLLIWNRYGRDPQKGTIIPLFSPPDRLSPQEIRYISKMEYDKKAFTACLVNLAVKGALNIAEEGEYILTKTNANGSDLDETELAVMQALFASSNSIVMNTGNHLLIRKAMDILRFAMAKKATSNYFLTNRVYLIPGIILSALLIAAAIIARPGYQQFLGVFMVMWLSIWSIGVIALLVHITALWRRVLTAGSARALSLGGAITGSLFAAPFLAAEIFGIGVLTYAVTPALMAVIVGLGIINYTFYRLLPAPTILGRAVMDKIEGFKMFLEATEKDRLKVLSFQKKTPELYERFLPYALALDVEDAWTAQFTDVLRRASAEGEQYHPAWYSGNWHDSRGIVGFGSMLGKSFSNSVSAASVAPGSSSGSGGGGSSGGGGGGGGGGGW